MLPEIKVYKIDYEFIISNYLQPRLWQKVWNLFVYKEHTFTLNLFSIDTKNKKIKFEIRKNGWWNYEFVDYSIENTSLKILKQQINGALFRLMKSWECRMIEQTDGYKAIENSRDEERNRLRDIACNFLDENGVTNNDIRDVYIDNYVTKNEKTWTMLQNYVDYYEYNYCTDMLLTFCKITGDESREKIIRDAAHNLLELNNLSLEVDTYIQALNDGDFDEEYTDCLEAI